jgi:hypothetical protein
LEALKSAKVICFETPRRKLNKTSGRFPAYKVTSEGAFQSGGRREGTHGVHGLTCEIHSYEKLRRSGSERSVPSWVSFGLEKASRHRTYRSRATSATPSVSLGKSLKSEWKIRISKPFPIKACITFSGGKKNEAARLGYRSEGPFWISTLTTNVVHELQKLFDEEKGVRA